MGVNNWQYDDDVVNAPGGHLDDGGRFSPPPTGTGYTPAAPTTPIDVAPPPTPRGTVEIEDVTTATPILIDDPATPGGSGGIVGNAPKPPDSGTPAAPSPAGLVPSSTSAASDVPGGAVDSDGETDASASAWPRYFVVALIIGAALIFFATKRKEDKKK